MMATPLAKPIQTPFETAMDAFHVEYQKWGVQPHGLDVNWHVVYREQNAVVKVVYVGPVSLIEAERELHLARCQGAMAAAFRAFALSQPLPEVTELITDLINDMWANEAWQIVSNAILASVPRNPKDLS